MSTDGLECCDVFIRLSFWRHPSLQSIRCWDTDARHTSPIWWRNKLIYISDSLRESTFPAHFNWTIPLRTVILLFMMTSATQCMVGLSQTVHAESSQQHLTFNKCFCTSRQFKTSALADFAKVSKSKCRAVFIVKLLWNSTFCETRFTNTTKWIFYISVTGAGNPTVRRGTEHKMTATQQDTEMTLLSTGLFHRKLPSNWVNAFVRLTIISVRRENPRVKSYGNDCISRL